MAQCITCGSELYPDRAKKYDYCMAPACQEKNLKGPDHPYLEKPGKALSGLSTVAAAGGNLGLAGGAVAGRARLCGWAG